MTHSRFGLATLALVMSVAACDVPGPSAPDAQIDDELTTILASASADPRVASTAGNSLFDRLAAEIPGFGGLYRTGVCSVAVVLTDLTGSGAAVELVKKALNDIAGRSCREGFRVQAVQGKFTYVELQRWLGAADRLLNIRGVQNVHVDYQKNLVVVTVAARSVAAEVIAALPALGIPAEAVAFELGGNRNP